MALMLIDKRSGRRLMNQINVVPYIDVMLVLLVIFMITAPLINPGQIELPQVGKTSDPAGAADGGVDPHRRHAVAARPRCARPRSRRYRARS